MVHENYILMYFIINRGDTDMDKKSMIYMTLNFLYSIIMVYIDTKLYNNDNMAVGHNTTPGTITQCLRRQVIHLDTRGSENLKDCDCPEDCSCTCIYPKKQKRR